jgi:hypothetical protein
MKSSKQLEYSIIYADSINMPIVDAVYIWYSTKNSTLSGSDRILSSLSCSMSKDWYSLACYQFWRLASPQEFSSTQTFEFVSFLMTEKTLLESCMHSLLIIYKNYALSSPALLDPHPDFTR